MPPIVVDASVLVKTVLPETESAEVRAGLLGAGARGDPLLAPMLARYEVGSTLLRRARASGESAAEIEESRSRALELVDLVEDDGPVAPLAVKHGLSYYDASYLALALARGAALWTYDRALGKAAETEGVRATAQDLDSE